MLVFPDFLCQLSKTYTHQGQGQGSPACNAMPDPSLASLKHCFVLQAGVCVALDNSGHMCTAAASQSPTPLSSRGYSKCCVHQAPVRLQESAAARAEREAREDAEALRQTAAARGSQTAVAPVFRTSPYSAEARAVRDASRTARLLFLDEGNLCRRARLEHLHWHCLLQMW